MGLQAAVQLWCEEDCAGWFQRCKTKKKCVLILTLVPSVVSFQSRNLLLYAVSIPSEGLVKGQKHRQV